jgi:hypothetical protein
MPQTRKPQPPSQREISNNQIKPYVFPETGNTLGNPNDPNVFEQFTQDQQHGVDFNRSEKLSLKNDPIKPFTLGLQDIDESIMYYFNKVIRPFVVQNGKRIPVPVIYGAPERWKSAQRDGYYKDKRGKIMAPIIMFKRDSMDKLRNVGNKLDGNTPNLYSYWKRTYNPKDSYSNFSVLNNRKPTQQFTVNVIPDYVKLVYNCTIQTYYIDQLNKIVEAVNYASDSYWGDPERFKFKASIDSYATTVELNDGQDRIVKSTFSINMFGYIIPESIQKQISSIKKYNNKSQIVIGLETTRKI